MTNTGDRAGDEVVQLYVKHLNLAVERPLQELKGFQRISLGLGETTTVTMNLSASELAYWDTGKQRFVLEASTIQIRIGGSSADIQLEETLEVAPSTELDGPTAGDAREP